jgi:hypothetical protein
MNSVKTGLKKLKILVQRGFTLGAAVFGEFEVFKMGKMIVHELHGLRNDEEVGL